MEPTKKTFPCELALVIGVALNSFCVSLMVKSDFGISTLSSVPLVLSHIFTSLSFGTWNFLIQGLSVAVLIAVTRRFKVGYLLSFLIGDVFGWLLDFYGGLMLPWPDALPWRVLYFAAGFFLMTFGASLFIKCRLPVLPFDTFVRDMTAFLKVPVRWVKTAFDLFCVAITLLLSFGILGYLDGVGAGTILAALFTGAVTNRICDWLERAFDFQPSLAPVRRVMARGKG